MKTSLIVVLAVIGTALQVAAQPRVITLVNHSDQTNNLDIADFEYVKVLTALDMAATCCVVSELVLIKDNVEISLGRVPGPLLDGWKPSDAYISLVFAGPATISLRSWGGHPPKAPALVTVEVCPTAYPVTNSVVLGPGQGGQINLESSTNLVQWTPATNGVYTAEAAMFFRLHLRRIQ